MSKKSIYVIKYLTFSFAPVFLLAVAMSTLLIVGAKSNNNTFEIILALVISVATITALILYFSINIILFLSMIKKQEQKYKTTFNDNNARIFAKHFSWIVLSDNWVFSPGKFAIFQNDIKSASMGEAYSEYKSGVIYPVKIKTFSGKVYKLKLKSQQEARTLKKWSRR